MTTAAAVEETWDHCEPQLAFADKLRVGVSAASPEVGLLEESGTTLRSAGEERETDSPLKKKNKKKAAVEIKEIAKLQEKEIVGR